MPKAPYSEQEEGVENLRQVIATFTRVRDEILKRRSGATDGVMVVLDERLAVNTRTLEALKRSLKLAEEELRRHRG